MNSNHATKDHIALSSKVTDGWELGSVEHEDDELLHMSMSLAVDMFSEDPSPKASQSIATRTKLGVLRAKNRRLMHKWRECSASVYPVFHPVFQDLVTESSAPAEAAASGGACDPTFTIGPDWAREATGSHELQFAQHATKGQKM